MLLSFFKEEKGFNKVRIILEHPSMVFKFLQCIVYLISGSKRKLSKNDLFKWGFMAQIANVVPLKLLHSLEVFEIVL